MNLAHEVIKLKAELGDLREQVKELQDLKRRSSSPSILDVQHKVRR